MAGIPGIIYPPTLDFDFLIQRPQQLLKAISRLGVTVYFLNRPAHHRVQIRGVERYDDNFYLFHDMEPSYPAHVRPVVYYSNPTQVDSIGRYRHSLLVFDSLDEVANEFSSWKPYYYRAVASADLVLAASQQLYLKALSINPHTLLLPNGCDYNYFNQARNEALSLSPPSDLPELKQAVIGYIGAVASWCDLELIECLAVAYPNCSLLIIGPLLNVRNIPQHPNIHWLGYKPYGQLIYYARSFNVGIIPFKPSEMTRAVNPIKMWEYMAMGIPVVTTALPEARHYGNLVYYSATRQEFIHNIGRALRNENWQRCEQRMALARDNSWIARARQMLLAIEERLEALNINSVPNLPVPADAKDYRPKNYIYELAKVKFSHHRKKLEIAAKSESHFVRNSSIEGNLKQSAPKGRSTKVQISSRRPQAMQIILNSCFKRGFS